MIDQSILPESKVASGISARKAGSISARKNAVPTFRAGLEAATRPKNDGICPQQD
jgi:hypothetical protein